MAGIKDILKIEPQEIGKMTRSQLAQITSQLASAANKRLRRFEEAGKTTSATFYVERSGGRFSVAGKNINELRREFARAKGFLEARTGSLAGVKRVERETAETLAKRGIDISSEEVGELFSKYDRLKERDPTIIEQQNKYRALRELSSMPDSMDIEEQILAAQERLEELEDEDAETNAQFAAGASRYFK